MKAPDLFATIEQDHAVTTQWLIDYNEYRSHEALGCGPSLQVTCKVRCKHPCLLR
ncbi:hypothetical protein ERE07_19905 [Allopusillimonas ginsengisoli]|nr:hypothetical protein ERE07_19905 [Allopusillimonas ginsengisoli]